MKPHPQKHFVIRVKETNFDKTEKCRQFSEGKFLQL